MHFKLKTFRPDKPTEFWCNCCDYVKVRSDVPETGQFFIQFGHTLSNRRITDDYEPVVFALCHECIGMTETDDPEYEARRAE